MPLIKLIIQHLKNLLLKNRSIYRVVLVISVISPLSYATSLYVGPSKGNERKDNTPSQGIPATPKCECLKRVSENGGEVLVDGSLRVFEPVMGKVFDLVEVSTPVTPAANHARLFLRADGTKQTLVILYDDGTIDNIASN